MDKKIQSRVTPAGTLKEITSPAATAVCAIEYNDRNHDWTLYSIDKVEFALRKHGYIEEEEHYRKFDSNRECLIFGTSVLEYTLDWHSLRFRLKLADFFFKMMRWCYYNFRPQ